MSEELTLITLERLGKEYAKVIGEREALQAKLDKYEEEASCGHPEKFWKVEPDNATAWCVMCALDDALRGSRDNADWFDCLKEDYDVLKRKLDIAVKWIEGLREESGSSTWQKAIDGILEKLEEK